MAAARLFSPPSLSFSLIPISKPPSISTPIVIKSRSSSFSLRYSPPPSSFFPTTDPLTGLTSFDSEPDKWDPTQYEAMLKGGEQVTSLLEEMIILLEDMEMDSAAAEAAAVEIAAQGVIGKRVDEMESGFMMALDYMIQIADKDNDDQTMESRPAIPDRKLLARLVLIREEARNMMGGGLLDERNDRGLSTLPEAEVNFLSKLVALRPGKPVKEMINDVMLGKDEGADPSASIDEYSTNTQQKLSGIAGRGSVTGRKPRPVRPGMFLETISKVLGGIYAGNVSGITAQHLEWVHQTTLQVLQEMAF